jgi:four helix bundle protein
MGRFVQIAMGSASELDYLIRLAKDLGYFQSVVHDELADQTREIGRMLTAFYKRIRQTSERKPTLQVAKS